MIAHISQTTGLSKDWFSSFTASELLEILPIGYSVYKSSCNNYIAYNQHTLESECFKDKNICDSLAKLLIYLLETNRMEIPKCP